MLTKTRVQEFLKEIEVDDLVQNFQVMGDDVYIDNCTFSSNARKEEAGSSHEAGFCYEFGDQVVLKLKITSPEPSEFNKPNQRKRNSRIQKYIAIASGKGGVGKIYGYCKT